MKAYGFDNEKYLEIQSQQIQKRINMFDNKLYLEMGGKLFDDYHASRVLPGFLPDSKVKMLSQLASQVEIVIAINAGDIEKNKVRSDIGITYDADVLRLIDAFRGIGLYVGSVVLTQYAGQPSATTWSRWALRCFCIIRLRDTLPAFPASSAKMDLAKTNTSPPADR